MSLHVMLHRRCLLFDAKLTKNQSNLTHYYRLFAPKLKKNYSVVLRLPWGHMHVTCPQCHGKGYFMTD